MQQFMQATQMQLQHQKHMQMQDTLIRESQELVQDMHACMEMATAITTAITTANTQLEQVQEELKETKQQITIMQEKVDKANKQVAAKNASIEKEVL
jgi:predicted  nucleic acid-binding Zn-ribbon protein